MRKNGSSNTCTRTVHCSNCVVFQGTKKETKASKPDAAAESKPVAKKPPPKSATGGGGGGASKGKGKGGAVGGVGEPPEVSEANVSVRNTCVYMYIMIH